MDDRTLFQAFSRSLAGRRTSGSAQMDEPVADVLEAVSLEYDAIEDALDDDDTDGEPVINEEGALWRPHTEHKEDRTTMLIYPNSLPYRCESLDEFDAQLENVIKHLAYSLQARDYDVAFMQLTKQLDLLSSLKYPIKRQHRAILGKMLYEVAVLPGIDPRICDNAASLCTVLIDNHKRVDIYDLQLDWRPLYDTLVRELFPKRRKAGIVAVSNALLGLAEIAQRFFPPHEATAILETVLPRFNGGSVNSCVSTQTFLVNFLPLSHPTEWLPAVFALWRSIQSTYWDSQWLDLAARLAQKHLDPRISDPRVAADLKIRCSAAPSTSINGFSELENEIDKSRWPGIRKDVGIFSAADWSFMMTKGLAALNVPIGGLSGTGMGAFVDQKVVQSTISVQRQSNKQYILSLLIVSSIGSDGQALRDLAKFINATESFFHPSNASGTWGYTLGNFLQSLASTLVKRVHAEERPTCKTPLHWRLTSEQRREFVSILRTPMLLGLFSKDASLAISSQAALRSLAHIEPDLILPPVLERVYPALETVLETHRTTAALTSLSSLALVMAQRKLYPAGARHLLPLCDLAVPGLDVNDPTKTITTCLFFCNAFTAVALEDLTHPDLMQMDSDPDQTGDEDDLVIRNSTAMLPDLIERCLRSVLAICDNLPEPGKAGRIGGKLEESMSNSLTAFMELLCTAMSASLYDIALDIFYEHVARSPKANSSRIIGHLMGCFTRADCRKCLDRFVPLCIQQIAAELEGGASAIASTSTLRYDEVDVALQWYAHLLGGVIGNAHGEAVQPYTAKLVQLFLLMAEKCKSERGYTHAARLVGYAFSASTQYYPLNLHFLNKEEREEESFATSQHLTWGRMYEAREVNIEWYTPGEWTVDFALSILRKVVEPALSGLEDLVHAPHTPNSTDRIWANDFCRRLALVKAVLPGFGNLIGVPHNDVPGKAVTDRGDCLPAFFDFDFRCKTGSLLQDAGDPRFVYVIEIRKRIAMLLHAAAARLKDSAAEDAFDCVRMVISTIKSFCYDIPFDHNVHLTAKKSYEFVRSFTSYSNAQVKYPRAVWIRRAYLYHYTRLRASSVDRQRSSLDDLLINDICDLCLSKSVSVRKSAQRTLECLIRCFDGVRTMLQVKLLDALNRGPVYQTKYLALNVFAAGVEPDLIRTSTLSLKVYQNFSILNWPAEPRFILSLLKSQHQEKQSIQKIVTRIMQDFLSRLAEPSNIIYTLPAKSIDDVVSEVYRMLDIPSSDNVAARLATHRQQRRDSVDQAHAQLMNQLLSIAALPSTHHRYQTMALRFMRNLMRRDQPLPTELVDYITGQVLSELPTQRFWAFSTLSRVLHYVKLRSLTKDDPLALLLQKAKNPLSIKVDVPQPTDETYTSDFVERFTEPLKSDSILVEKHANGWLMWGRHLKGYRLPPQDGRAFEWSKENTQVLGIIRSSILQAPFWDSVVKQFTQEVTREYMSAENTVFVKSIISCFEDVELLDLLLRVVDGLLIDKDRHKQRAATEILGGIFRGIKHWSGTNRDYLWAWASTRFDSMLSRTTAETQTAFLMLIEYSLADRDPRRNQPLLEWLFKLKLDHRSTQAFQQAKVGLCLVEAFKALDWHSEAWTSKHLVNFDASIDSPFQEVRIAVASAQIVLNQLRLYPSFTSLDALLARASALSSSEGRELLISPDDTYRNGLRATSQALGKLKAVRQPSASGQQVYDEAASTVLFRMEGALQSHRLGGVYPIVEELMTDLFAMQELIDNEELSSQAKDTLAMVGVMSYPAPIANDLLRNLITLLSTSSSWRTRLDVLPILQPIFFYQLFVLDEDLIMQLLDVLCDVMRHANLDVREAASRTLSGIIRCSQRSAILRLKERFLGVLRETKLPKRRDEQGNEVAGYQEALAAVHSAVLGASALVSAFPYSVPSWLPGLLLEVGHAHASSPAPISASVKRMLSDFKRSHTDSWAEDQKAFSAEELLDLNDLYQGGTYYA